MDDIQIKQPNIILVNEELNGCILPHEQYSLILKVSYISGFTSLYAFYNNYIDIAGVNFCVFLSSINYWRKPDYSWRRTLDMTFVKIALVYELIRAYEAEYSRIYYSLLFIGICFYYIGIYCDRQKLYWYSTYSHCLLHIFGNIAKIILYSGIILAIEENKIITLVTLTQSTSNNLAICSSVNFSGNCTLK
jgi:hypothetical protein